MKHRFPWLSDDALVWQREVYRRVQSRWLTDLVMCDLLDDAEYEEGLLRVYGIAMEDQE